MRRHIAVFGMLTALIVGLWSCESQQEDASSAEAEAANIELGSDGVKVRTGDETKHDKNVEIGPGGVTVKGEKGTVNVGEAGVEAEQGDDQVRVDSKAVRAEDETGDKATVDSDGKVVTARDKDGKEATIERDGDQLRVKSGGETVHIEKDKKGKAVKVNVGGVDINVNK
ncbi:MAG: hypothetical protein ACLFVJ_12400 [Persicimonas sp.]